MADDFLTALIGAAGIDSVSVDFSDRLLYARDMWPRFSIKLMNDEVPSALPRAVVWPRDEASVSAVMSVCSRYGVPVTPYGGGSGVCGSAVPAEGGVVLDLKRMNRVLGLDTLGMTCRVQGGILGQDLEGFLNARGFTLGHFPSSIMCSTVGGWVSTRSAGQFSSRYGKVEDMVLGLTVVLPGGERVFLDLTSPGESGLDLGRIMLGSEGTLGVVTDVLLRVHHLPGARLYKGFRFADVTSGLETMRAIMQQGLRPTVARLYDPLDTLLNGLSRTARRMGEPSWGDRYWKAVRKLLGDAGIRLGRGGVSSLLTGPGLKVILSHPWIVHHLVNALPLSCLLVAGFEGEDERVRRNMEHTTFLARRAGGKDLGSEPGSRWLRKRYSVSFKLTKVFGQGGFAETIETAALWRHLPLLYERTRKAVRSSLIVMAHFSHAYREGCAIYFTVAGHHPMPARLLDLYDKGIARMLGVIVEAGGVLSHHHGIGLMKQGFTSRETKGGETMFWALKQVLDPSQVMNPGKVYSQTVPVVPQNRITEEKRPERFDSVLSWEHWSRGRDVVLPEVPEEVSDILKLAQRAGVPVWCQCPRPRGARGITLDLGRLDAIIEMDPVSGAVTAQAGIPMIHLENFLREKGFSLGYVPRSSLQKQLGEYLAWSSPAETSPMYGGTTDNCLGISAILPDGTVFSARPSPRRAVGPGLMNLFLGGRGRYGVITAACMRVFPLPASRVALGYGMDDPVLAISAIRTLLVRGLRPEWSLVVVRAPAQSRDRRRVRVVMQLGGRQGQVTLWAAIVRSVFEPLGVVEERAAVEDRMQPLRTRFESIERFLDMQRVMDMAGHAVDHASETFPEMHVTDIHPHGATVRMLKPNDAHVFPPALERTLRMPPPDGRVAKVARALKCALDPGMVLNPHANSEEP